MIACVNVHSACHCHFLEHACRGCYNMARSCKLCTAARQTRRQALGSTASPGVARASRHWTIMLLQQSAFYKPRTDARQARRQPLRRYRATSPCRGGFSCRENVSAVVLRPWPRTAARHVRWPTSVSVRLTSYRRNGIFALSYVFYISWEWTCDFCNAIVLQSCRAKGNA